VAVAPAVGLERIAVKAKWRRHKAQAGWQLGLILPFDFSENLDSVAKTEEDEDQ
jgi:hypothetical protein